ncbi:MAG TPA: hypothetical protein VIS48_08940 [Candidatus Kryptonia bacterium]
MNSDSRYELWSNKQVLVEGRRHDELYFAGIKIQSSFVGSYFMPICSDTSVRDKLGKNILSKLKRKSCFHIKEIDRSTILQIKTALEVGFRSYQKSGWV